MLAILIGLPTWYVIGILVNQSDRFAEKMFGSTALDSGRAIMFAYIGIAFGDILIGLVSQYFQSRKKSPSLILYTHHYFICLLLQSPKPNRYFYVLGLYGIRV